jgi:hypothetical protein
MSNRGQIFNRSAILRQRVQSLVTLLTELQRLRARLQRLKERRRERRSFPKGVSRRRHIRR